MSSPSQAQLFAGAAKMASGLKTHLLLLGVAAAMSSTTIPKQRVTLGRVRPIVAPSVAKANFLALGTELEACTAAGCEWLHCSVQDGVFVPKVSFGAPVVSAARKACPDTVIDASIGLDTIVYRGDDAVKCAVLAAVAVPGALPPGAAQSNQAHL